MLLRALPSSATHVVVEALHAVREGRVTREGLTLGAGQECAHPECEPYRDNVGCIRTCPMCGRDYNNHPNCTACDATGHSAETCPLVKEYDSDAD